MYPYKLERNAPERESLAAQAGGGLQASYSHKVPSGPGDPANLSLISICRAVQHSVPVPHSVSVVLHIVPVLDNVPALPQCSLYL